MPRADRAAIEAFLRRAPFLHAYELGDLDPREAAHTTWIAGDPVDAVVLIYRGLATPTIVALADDGPAALAALQARLAAALDQLPDHFYAHLSPGAEAALAAGHDLGLLGHHCKMGLVAAPPVAAPPAEVADPAIVRLAPADADEAVAFYATAYPGSYFEPVSLTRGPYVAIRDDRGLAAVAGTHVYSPAMRVASLGNIATRPDARGRGLARRVTAAMCRLLRPEIDTLGLNVRADNPAAIACYRGVGFEIRHRYDEWRVTRRAA